ncbi:MAG TPA: LytTR family DNA-binding domain-containing protein [Gemmatimonadales bacterium]|jgi:DNA-binding LytR/AlgR family response regulator
MRVLIVDDEPAARRRLHTMLEELDVEVAGEAANGLEALDRVTSLRPDVLLLDIAMPEVDGFDVVRHLSDPRPLVVFQTAYDEHALEAFNHAALDYVVKPVRLDRLKQALDRARARLATERAASVGGDVLSRLQAALPGAAKVRRPRLLVRDGTGRVLLPLREIVRFVASDGVVAAVARGTSWTTDYTLTELEQRTGGSFVRANRADLVNVDHITRLEPETDGSALLSLSDKTRIRVSRRRAAEVRRLLEE